MPKTPEQIQAQLSTYSDSRHAAWRAIRKRCDTGEAFTREDQTLMLDVIAEAWGLESLLIRAFCPMPTSPKGPAEYPLNEEHVSQAETVTLRVLGLKKRLCGGKDGRDGKQAPQVS